MYRVSQKKRPTLVFGITSPPCRLFKKVRTLWPCPVHADEGNYMIFYPRVQFGQGIVQNVSNSHFRVPKMTKNYS
jgi:hypothetical protein